MTNWYNNYTIEYVPDGGHFLMMEKPDLVIDCIRRMKACVAGAALSALAEGWHTSSAEDGTPSEHR